MKPGVFVGVLLFLIAAVLAYSFGSWIGELCDRRKQRRQAPATAEKHPPPPEAAAVATTEVLAPHPMAVAMASSAAVQPAPAIVKPEPTIESVVSAPPPMPMPPSAMAAPETTSAVTAAPLPKSTKPPSAPATPVTRYGSPALSALAEHALAESSPNEPVPEAHPKPDVKATLPPGVSIASQAPPEPQPVSPSSHFDGPQPDVRATLPPANRA